MFLLWTHILKDLSFCCNKNWSWLKSELRISLGEQDFASYGGIVVRTVANFTVLLPTIVLRDVSFSKAINSDCGYMWSYSSQRSLGKRYTCKKHLHRRFLCAAKSVQCHNAKRWGFSLTECNSMEKSENKNLLLYKERICRDLLDRMQLWLNKMWFWSYPSSLPSVH